MVATAQETRYEALIRLSEAIRSSKQEDLFRMLGAELRQMVKISTTHRGKELLITLRLREFVDQKLHALDREGHRRPRLPGLRRARIPSGRRSQLREEPQRFGRNHASV